MLPWQPIQKILAIFFQKLEPLAFQWCIDIAFNKKILRLKVLWHYLTWLKNERWSFSKKYMEIWYFLQMLRKVGPSKNSCAGTLSFLYYQEILYFFFQKIWSCSLEEKWKIVFLKQIPGNMIFSAYSVKLVFLFPTNMILPFGQKSKDDLLPKNTRKHDISGIS